VPIGQGGDELKLLAIMRPRDGVDVRAEVPRHAHTELRALWQLYRDGVVREMYSPGGPGAILLLETESVQTAERLLGALPLISSGVMALEVTQLRPFSAIEMLFSSATPS
jgi:hypothetical protein